MTGSVRRICPYCRGELAGDQESLRCDSCQRAFPVLLDIPDLRVAPDPWIGLVEDRAKALRVERESAPGFEAAVRHYWALTPGTPTADATRHIDHVLHAGERTAEWVAALTPTPTPGEQWLDLGCGTADLAAAAPPGVTVSGLDIAFRWLVIARRRLREAERTADLVCGNAEALPHPDASFDRVIALGTLEHCADLGAALAEARRVLRPGGHLHIRTANRYSLLAEPHVGIWGAGWLPRHWADRYVRWRGGTGYQHHWPRGAGALARALDRAGFRQVTVRAAGMLAAERSRLPAALAPMLPVYDAMRRLPIGGRACRAVAPLLDAQGVAP